MRSRAAVLLLLGAAATADAQIVRGRVSEAESGAPLTGVFVVLLDSTSAPRAGALTNAQGAFNLRVPFNGTFRLRAERIGHQSTVTEPAVLATDRSSSIDLRVGVAAVELAPLEVSTATRCALSPSSGRRTAQLWEEARKALSVARWVEMENLLQFESRSYVRELSAPSLQVTKETSTTRRVSGKLPYSAISAATLARYGYVLNENGNHAFYGPDAEVLLSDQFLAGHCFRAVDGSGENREHIGLAFKPVPGNRRAEIEGTLWLDARTLELRHIQFRYVNVAPEFQLGGGAGGRTYFQRLSNGAWIVNRWYIRVPTQIYSQHGRPTSVMAFREEGGSVSSAPEAQFQETLPRGGAITGMVYDSVRGLPLDHALVYLSGTSHQATSSADGRFQLGAIPPGTYRVAFSHPRLDSLPALPAPQEVRVAAGDTLTLVLATNALHTQLARACNGRDGGILFGQVVGDQGAIAANASITVNMRRFRKEGGGIVAHTVRETVRADAAGSYVVCGLPIDQPLGVSATSRDVATKPIDVRIEGQPYLRLDLRVRH